MSNPYDKQVGGNHYQSMKIQPAEFINKNKLPFAEGNAIKYICRHINKGGEQDLEKAKHYIDMIIERDYGNQIKPLPYGFTLTKDPDMIPMTEEEEYRNAGITKEKAETSSKEWIKGYKEWKQNQKERCPHN